MQIKRFVECHFLANFQSRQVLRQVKCCPCAVIVKQEARTRRSLMVKRRAYSRINEEKTRGSLPNSTFEAA